jgi:hypothetical protein
MNVPILLESITPETRARFIQRVTKTDGCWLWTGATTKFGYGRLSHNGKMISAHRLSFLLAGNELPTELCVLHKCDNPACVRPDHLFSGTKADNNEDTKRKGRHPGTIKTHCKHGHAFTPENTVRVNGRPGHRHCRKCRNESWKKYHVPRTSLPSSKE